MNIIFYYPSCQRQDHPCQFLLDNPGLENSREVHDSWEGFCQRMRSPWLGPCCLVLIPDNVHQLELAVSAAELFSSLPVVLVLPSCDPPLVQKAHRLRPRFLAGLEDDPTQTMAVLMKICAKLGS